MDKKNIIIASLVIILIFLGYLIFTKNKDSELVDNQTPTPTPIVTPTPTPTPSITVTPTPTPTGAQIFSTAVSSNWLVKGATLNNSVVDMNVNVPQAMTLNFDKTKKTYSGFSGCNTFSGTYTSAAAGKFSFGTTTGTKKYCTDSSAMESKILEAMGKVENFTVTAEGNLVLISADGKTKVEYQPAI